MKAWQKHLICDRHSFDRGQMCQLDCRRCRRRMARFKNMIELTQKTVDSFSEDDFHHVEQILASSVRRIDAILRGMEMLAQDRRRLTRQRAQLESARYAIARGYGVPGHVPSREEQETLAGQLTKVENHER